jgi:tetratricopeptide (TPR) repeat protein
MSKEIQSAVTERAKSRERSSAAHDIAATRVSPASYVGALFLFSFITALLVYLELDTIGLIILGVTLIAVPLLAYTDRIGFNGKRLRRTGLLPRLWSRATGLRDRIRITDIEQVETQALRALKRGRNIKYRFSTTVRGKGLSFTFASGGGSYRKMISALLPVLPENVLDARSIELRDYLSDPSEVLKNAEDSRIPPADVLEGPLLQTGKAKEKPHPTPSDVEAYSADPGQLRRLANQLRLSGFLLQALEAFRRALILEPHNGWLLLETGRCLQSLAGSEKNPRLERRSVAFMRLAELRAGADRELLSRVGESYFQAGESRRAGLVFRYVADTLGESFRSVRGMAEMALREGKIAHVIHHFNTANRIADSKALKRWARGEADYFARLNDDEDYLELEVSRMNLIERLERYQKTSLRAVLFGFPLIVVGVLVEEYSVANTGWIIAAAAIAAWFGMSLTGRLMSTRIPVDMVVSDDDV